MIAKLLSQWRIQLLAIALLFSLFGIFFTGLVFGIDFSGGTSFQIKLAKPVSSPDEKEQIRSIIEQRLNFTGLRDATVSFVGEDLLFADIAETDPQQVEALETLLLRQGKFEATLDGNVLFTGSDFQVIKDPARGYGLQPSTDGTANWVLPFLLKPAAAKRFTEMTFHRCELVGVDSAGQRDYDCARTYFFIDRPQETVLVFSSRLFAEDQAKLSTGNPVTDIPANSSLPELLSNAAIPFVVLDENTLDSNSTAWQTLAQLSQTHSIAIVPDFLGAENKERLTTMGFSVKTLAVPSDAPFSWVATGARSVISLTPGVTNLDPFVAEPSSAKVFSELVIQGTASSAPEAQDRLTTLTILLQSGSLPIAVDSIGKETISPLLGKQFLQDALYMGIVALFMVMLIVFVRYRRLYLALPLGFISLCEVLLILGFAAFTRWNLDLASMAGIIAAIGTGVNQQIIITDEVLREGVLRENASMANRTKRALFIIVASAATVLATMLPIIFFGFGLGKLVGFAVTTTVGVLVGVFITRPAYSEFAKYLLSQNKE